MAAAPPSTHVLTREEKMALSEHSYAFSAKVPLPTWEWDLAKNWAQRKEELLANQLQPYADILYDIITRSLDIPTVIAQLVEKAKTAGSVRDLSVPIWTFKHCPTYYTHRHDLSGSLHVDRVRAGDVEAKHAEIIYREGWVGLLKTERFESTWDYDWYTELSTQEIDRVFRKTDLKHRLALLFGGRRFTVTVRHTSREEVIDGISFYPQTNEVTLNYYPNDIPPHARKILGKTAVKYAAHEPLPSVIRAVVDRTDRVILSDGKDVIATRRAILGPDFDI
jgi:hypothetical protein